MHQIIAQSIMTKIFLLFIMVLCTLTSQEQLLQDKRFHPGTTIIKSSPRKGFHSIEKLDSLGRKVERSGFRNKTLITKSVYQYNNQNDIISEIVVYDKNRPHETDTTTYEYTYVNEKITIEKYIPGKSKQDSIIFRLVKNIGDSVLTYQRLHYGATKRNQPWEETYTLTWQNNMLASKEVINDIVDKETTHYEYFPNGLVKHKVEERTPELRGKVMYAGGYNSDDQYYSYTYDRKGRVKVIYTTYDNHTYKVKTYKYK